MLFHKNIHYSTGLERAILGACLIDLQSFGRIYQSVNTECFYHDGHKLIFQTLKDMYINGLPIDILTVIDHLNRVKNIKEIHQTNTDYFITKLTQEVVNTTHLEYHSHIVKIMWMEREILLLTHGGEQLTGDTLQKLTHIQEKLYEIQQKTITHDWSDMTKLMVELYQHQEEIKRTGGVGLACGIKEIDRENGGFHPGQMIVIGARPSVGKSALAGGIALHAGHNGKKVGIISLEMSNTEIAARLGAIDTNTDFRVLFRGLYDDEEEMYKVYRKIGDQTSKLPIYVTDKTNVTIAEIRSKADKLKSLHGIDLLIIDYLQLIDVPEMQNRNRENEISRVSRYCKVMAKEMNIPVILLCQLNRESTRRHGEARYPQLSDIRESGSIEQDADVVMFLHRDWMVGIVSDDNGNTTEFQADLVIRKWRNGKNNFIIPLDFDPPKMKFSQKQTNGYKPVDVEYFNNQ